MGRRDDPAWAQGTVALTAARERGDVDRKFQNRLTVTRSLIDRLGLEKELHGHMGCVNCLEWNYDGSVLASASDDLHVILWDPYRYKLLHKIATGHTGNIFSVKFLSSDALATCAADGTVRARTVAGSSIWECSCHCGRVKRLASAPDNPFLLWSAGEDGLVLQHDIRTPHRCNSGYANVLVNLVNSIGCYAEAKCVAVNPRRPHQLAVGANDFYARLYDTRMIKLSKIQMRSRQSNSERQSALIARIGRGDPDYELPRGAVQYYAPGHLSINPIDQAFPKKAVTYIAFSHDGNELLVNLGSEQIYLYDINSARLPVLVESFIIEYNHANHDDEEQPKEPTSTEQPKGPDPGSNGTTPNGSEAQHQLPDRIRQLKESANAQVAKGNYAAAVELYNEAIGECPNSAVLYSNRAATLMRRGWCGDTYAAVRDCYAAIALDGAHAKAHFRLAKALMELRRAREAHECLGYFARRFPRHAHSHAVFLLRKDIATALDQDLPDTADECEETQASSPLERQLRASALDYGRRFLGHCNTTTDIKEANFLGPDAAFIAAGSDDGGMFIWSAASGGVVRCLRGDESILNCVAMHPAALLLASSGIEAAVRLWSPRPESGPEPRAVPDLAAAALANQRRMRSDPFEAMLFNISFAAGGEREVHSPACRTT